MDIVPVNCRNALFKNLRIAFYRAQREDCKIHPIWPIPISDLFIKACDLIDLEVKSGRGDFTHTYPYFIVTESFGSSRLLPSSP